ncbi:MAG: pyridoxamine 5'-phosphate oxidase family protein [Ilumatobacteraceae bacterium]
MSIQVPIPELQAKLADYPWAFLVTVSAEGRPHSLAVATEFFPDGALRLHVGRTSMANVGERPEVTLLFPPASGTEYSVVVDGLATPADGDLRVEATTAVLHRPALR